MTDTQTVLWSADGRPYWLDSATGKRTFIPPLTAAQYQNDPKLQAWAKSQGAQINYGGDPSNGTNTAQVVSNGRPDGGLLTNPGTWNQETGQWDQGINYGNLAALGIGGFIAAPLIAGAAGAAGAGGAAGSSGAAAGGVLPSTTIGAGAIPAVGGAASGAVPAAFGATGAAASGAGTVGGVIGGTAAGKGILPYVSPIASTIGGVINGILQKNANADALAQEIAAQKYATDATAKANADALAFTKQQAQYGADENAWSTRSNYDQWRAGQQRLSTLGNLAGLPDRDIPAYSAPPSFPGGSGMPDTGRPLASIDAAKPLQPQLAAYLTAQGGDPSEAAYFAQKWPELMQRGQQLNDPDYAMKRLSMADSILKRGAA